MTLLSDLELDGWFSDLSQATLDPPEWVIENVLPTGITFMVGPPKTLKSTIEMAFSLLVAGQECDVLPPDLSRVPEPGHVLGLSAEATAGELRFMAERGFRVTITAPHVIAIADDPWAFRLDDPGALTRLLDVLDSVKPRLVWLDPLRDFHELDEQDSGPMQRLLRPVQRWAKSQRAAFLVVHHTRKLGSGEDRNLKASDARGTSALFGLADGLITLTPKGEGTVHMDVVTKRGSPWERTVKLRVWGGADKPTVLVDGVARQVLEALASGMTQAQVAAHLGVGTATVSRRVAQLKELGALTPDGAVVSNGAALVAAALKTQNIGSKA